MFKHQTQTTLFVATVGNKKSSGLASSVAEDDVNTQYYGVKKWTNTKLTTLERRRCRFTSAQRVTTAMND